MHKFLTKIFGGKGFEKYPLYSFLRKMYLRLKKGKYIQVNGYVMEINYENCGDYDGRITGSIFEKKVVERLENAVGQNDTCLDIGASAGYYTLLFGILSHKPVAAIEPSKDFEILLRNIRRNNIQARTYQILASDENKEMSTFGSTWSTKMSDKRERDE